MESLKELYRIGHGPSSSHTMGPQNAAEVFLKKIPDASKYSVTLYGSLASTGKGHLTDIILKKTFEGHHVEINWQPDKVLPFHPNGMEFEAFDDSGKSINRWLVYSVGGGALSEGKAKKKASVYKLNNMHAILEWCKKNKREMWEYVIEAEGKEMMDYLREVWETMKSSINTGIKDYNILPGGLKLQRKASFYYRSSKMINGLMYKRLTLFAYALAVAEENAGGGKIVTAPTCGSCGVLPAVLLYCQDTYRINDEEIIKALATAGLIGNLVKFNGSISGAEVGCQGEIGTACAMAAGAAAQLLGANPLQIDYAAEMGIEHQLGMTCDPVDGLVQIPCIERNAMAAGRALDCAAYAVVSDGKHWVSFDDIIKVMTETGKDLSSSYRETSRGGMAKLLNGRKPKD